MRFSLVRQAASMAKRIQNLTYEKLTETHYDLVMEHLRNESYHDVPLYKAAGLVGPGKIAPPELDAVYYNSMKEGISTIIFDEGKFAGVIINGILTPDAVPGAIESMKKSKNESYKKMDYMFLQLLLDMDIFNRFGIDIAMECRLLSITREFRGTGLGKIVVDKLTETARKHKFPLIAGEAVNDYLWRLLTLCGWVMVREMPYTDYIDEATGKAIYKVDPPHHILGVCVKIVDDMCKCKDPLPLPGSKIYYPIKMD